MRETFLIGEQARRLHEHTRLAMIEPNRKGEVWIYAEQEDEHLSDTSVEMCSKARELADELGVGVGAVLVGWNVRELSYRLIAHGADHVYYVNDTRLEFYRTLPYARVLCQLIGKYKPQIVLYGATPLGRDLAPRIASEMRAGLTADCTDLRIGAYTDPRTKITHEEPFASDTPGIRREHHRDHRQPRSLAADGHRCAKACCGWGTAIRGAAGRSLRRRSNSTISSRRCG